MDQATIRRWILCGWLRARRTWRDYRAKREPDGWSIRRRAVTRALAMPEIAAELFERRAKRGG